MQSLVLGAGVWLGAAAQDEITGSVCWNMNQCSRLRIAISWCRCWGYITAASLQSRSLLQGPGICMNASAWDTKSVLLCSGMNVAGWLDQWLWVLSMYQRSRLRSDQWLRVLEYASVQQAEMWSVVVGAGAGVCIMLQIETCDQQCFRLGQTIVDFRSRNLYLFVTFLGSQHWKGILWSVRSAQRHQHNLFPQWSQELNSGCDISFCGVQPLRLTADSTPLDTRQMLARLVFSH